MALLRVTTMVSRAVDDWTVNSSLTRCVRGMVSVGLNAMMFV